MKTMKDIVVNFLEKNGAKHFNDIYDFVKNEKLEQWKVNLKINDVKKINEIKIGELYSLLTVDGDFTRKSDGSWLLSNTLTYEELKNLRIKNQELDEDFLS